MSVNILSANVSSSGIHYNSINQDENQESPCENETQPIEPINIKSKKSRELTIQIYLSILLILAAGSTGMIMGYSAVLLPQLESINGSLHLDEEMGSWIASVNTAAIPIGSILSGFLIDYCGRRLTLQIQTVIIIIGWIFILFAENLAVLLIGRLFGGIATGLGVVAGQIYVAEISDANMRGVFSSIPFSSAAIGILLIYIMGSLMHWRLIAGLSTILPAISGIMLYFFPESPVWLVRKGKIESARKACLWFRGNNDVKAQEEIQGLIDRVENERIQMSENSQSALKILCTPQVLKPLLITNALNFLQALSGVYLTIFYAVDIISQMGMPDINDFLAAVITAVVRLIFTILACFLLAIIGRRSIGLYSALGTAISAIVLGISLYFHDSTNGYFLATCLLIYIAANTVGLFILPGIMIGELFPAKSRGLAGSITYTIFSIFTFIVAKIFPFLKEYLQINGMFLLFGISALLASILIYLTLPETKDKTLNDVEDYFSQNNILWITRNQSHNIRKSAEANV